MENVTVHVFSRSHPRGAVEVGRVKPPGPHNVSHAHSMQLYKHGVGCWTTDSSRPRHFGVTA